MTLLASAPLKTVMRRDLKLDGSHQVGRTFVTIDADSLEVTPSGKAGVFVIKPNIYVENAHYVALVDINPELYTLGELSGRAYLTPGSYEFPGYLFRPLNKEFDLSSLEYFAKLYVLDGRLPK